LIQCIKWIFPDIVCPVCLHETGGPTNSFFKDTLKIKLWSQNSRKYERQKNYSYHENSNSLKKIKLFCKIASMAAVLSHFGLLCRVNLCHNNN